MAGILAGVEYARRRHTRKSYFCLCPTHYSSFTSSLKKSMMRRINSREDDKKLVTEAREAKVRLDIKKLATQSKSDGKISQELGNCQETIEESDSINKRMVLALYDALSSQDMERVHQIVSPNLDWWFHGPRSHMYLMRLLTGASSNDTSSFVPQSIASFGPTVLVEGLDPNRSISWVHVWTVADGIVTHVRENVNTSLTVTRLGNPPSDFTSSSSSYSKSTSKIVWTSVVSEKVGHSVPGLVLAL